MLKMTLEGYRIGGEIFVKHPETGEKHEITSGRTMTNVESAKFDDECSRQERLQKYYEARAEDEVRRHEKAMEEIHYEIFGY